MRSIPFVLAAFAFSAPALAMKRTDAGRIGDLPLPFSAGRRN